jgi:hypothetical protein
MKLKLPWAEDIGGRRFAFFGEVGQWPRYHGMSAQRTVQARGGVISETLSSDLHYVVFGSGRMKGKAAAERKAQALREKGSSLTILDEAGLIHLLRPKLDGTRFHFAGELSFGRGSTTTSPEVLVNTLGAALAPAVDAELDFLVVADRRGKGKAAAIAAAEKLVAAGAPLRIIDEGAFMDLLSAQAGAPANSPESSAASPLAEFVVALPSLTDTKRIERALDMLRKQSMQLYTDVADDHVAGIVRSQTGYADYYSTRLSADGRYSCCDSSLGWCMGMGGKPCKHLLVLLLGLVQSGELPVANAKTWLANTRQPKSRRAPPGENIQQLLADTILRYKAAEAGEVDWRPTETVPEDYYAY